MQSKDKLVWLDGGIGHFEVFRVSTNNELVRVATFFTGQDAADYCAVMESVMLRLIRQYAVHLGQ